MVVDGMSDNGMNGEAVGSGHGAPTAKVCSRCKSEWCSLGLMKMFCPSCFVIGLIILPFEAAIRGGLRVIRGH
jgi:hypothetical protein